MSIQKNVKVSFGIAAALLVASIVGLVATRTVQIEEAPVLQPVTRTYTDPAHESAKQPVVRSYTN